MVIELNLYDIEKVPKTLKSLIDKKVKNNQNTLFDFVKYEIEIEFDNFENKNMYLGNVYIQDEHNQIYILDLEEFLQEFSLN